MLDMAMVSPSESPSIQKSVLATIREQMASSLLKLRQLEERVKYIPVLEVKLSAVQEEKQSLLKQLEISQQTVDDMKRKINNLKNIEVQTPSPAIKTVKSVATSCSVLTRDIGVGHIPVQFKSIAVGCDTLPPISTSSESLESDLESLQEQRNSSYQTHKSTNIHVALSKKYIVQSHKSTSTDVALSKKHTIQSHKSTNTDVALSKKHALQLHKSTNTDVVLPKQNTTQLHKSTNTVAASSKKYTVQLHKSTSTDIASSKKLVVQLHKSTITDVALSKKCTVLSRSVQTSSDFKTFCNKHIQTLPALLKSVSIGDFDVNDQTCSKCKTPKKSVGVGDMSHSKENISSNRMKSIAVGDTDMFENICRTCYSVKNESRTKIETSSIGINAVSENREINICDKCSATIHSVARGLASSESKIPHLQTNKPPKLKIPSLQKPKEITIRKNENEDLLGDLTNIMSLSAEQRDKCEISQEIKAACKVLNDCLQKPDKSSEKNMSSSLNILQNEWFQIANQKNANPHLIEDYLDLFEEFSRQLLQRIVNLSDNNGNTALHYAVSYGNFDVVSILMESKVCDINKKNKAGYTSLMLVAALGNLKTDAHDFVVQRLFTLGDVNMKATQNGQTALMLAVSHGRKEIAKLLLDAGSEINLQDKDGSTALMCAAEHGYLEIVKLLLFHPECDPSIVDNDECNALTIAMEAGHKDIGLLIYTNMNFSRGSSPYSTLKSRKRLTTPPPMLRTPPLPSPSARSTNSIPSYFSFST